MTESYINFKKQRELGDIITDTFKFLRENYKHLFKLIFKIAGPLFLVLAGALAYYSYIGGEVMVNPFVSNQNEEDGGMFFISFFILLSSLLAFYVLLHGVILHFIKSYIQNSGKVNEIQVYEGMKQDFGSLLGLLFLVSIFTFIGLMLCVFPGIYLWVPLSLAAPSLVFKRNSLSSSISESFDLVRDNWWITFFSLFVVVLLVYIIALVFQMPLFIYYFIKALTIVQEGSAVDPSSLFDWVYVVFNVIASLAQYLLSTIVIIAVAFIYYSLDEKKNYTGSFETISQLGSSENS